MISQNHFLYFHLINFNFIYQIFIFINYASFREYFEHRLTFIHFIYLKISFHSFTTVNPHLNVHLLII
jgi:hypothetical protein